jgi:hypothetical protein
MHAVGRANVENVAGDSSRVAVFDRHEDAESAIRKLHVPLELCAVRGRQRRDVRLTGPGGEIAG